MSPIGIASHRLRIGYTHIYIEPREPRDLWVGMYVAPDAVSACPVPTLVLKVGRR